MRFSDIILERDFSPCPLCSKLNWDGEVCSTCLSGINNEETVESIATKALQEIEQGRPGWDCQAIAFEALTRMRNLK